MSDRAAPARNGFDDGLATTLLVCLVYPIGPAATILMPMIVGGLVDGYGFSEQQAGNVAAAEGMGLVVASVVATLWIRRVSWTRALLGSFAAYAAINLASVGIAGHDALLAVRFLAGAAGGNLFAVTVAALGDNRAPDRAFGLAQAVQGVMMLAGFLAAPALLAAGGVGALYGFLAGLSALTLVALRGFPAADRHGAPGAGAPAGGAGHAGLIWFGLAASVAYFVAVFGFWGFVERIGQAGGLPPETIGLALGASQVSGIAGGLAAAAASDRYGRYGPLLLVLAGQSAAVFAVAGEFGVAAYFFSAGAFQALFIVAVSYQMGAIALLDTRGRFLVLMTAAQGLGAAIGPAVAAGLIGPGDDYGGIVRMAAALVLASTLAFLWIIRASRDSRLDSPGGPTNPERAGI
jgi:predicted MFS family arabinose efflux permease